MSPANGSEEQKFIRKGGNQKRWMKLEQAKNTRTPGFLEFLVRLRDGWVLIRLHTTTTIITTNNNQPTRDSRKKEAIYWKCDF